MAVICVYEDEGLERLSPLVDLRPVFDLRCGRFTLLEKLRRMYPREEFHLWVRDELAEVVGEAHPDCRVNQPVRQGRLFISGRAILEKRIEPLGRESVLLAGDAVVGFRVCAECAEKMSSMQGLVATLNQEQVKAKVVMWPWDVVEFNAVELRRELVGPGTRSDFPKRESVMSLSGVVLVGPRSGLVVAPGARVWPGTVISTKTGPVVVDRGAQVRPGSFVEGPCYVGPGTVIDAAKVRPGCSFGPQCRIGGEVEASVFQGYANKHHDGFIGHSFVGEWTNLGALTTNSDLKNAYRPVQVFYRGKPIDTGLQKVGCFIGDHAKTAIGTLLNTGTRLGTFANWFEQGLSPKEVNAFSWRKAKWTKSETRSRKREAGAGGQDKWDIEEAVECARQVMARRGVKITPAYVRMLRRLWAAIRQS